MMEPLSLQTIAAYCEGTILEGRGNTLILGVTIDSRKTRPGDLFVALKGKRFDGHAYLGEALDRGAAAVLVERSALRDNGHSCAKVAVDHTRWALGRLAAAYRRQFTLSTVAVTGSNGKTTTRALIESLLGQRGATLASEGSFNNDIGVPLTLLRIERVHQAAVVEAGTNHFGELAPLIEMIQPRFGVLTSIGREHLEYLEDLSGVAREEGWVAELLPPDGKLFVNGESPQIERVIERTRARVVRAGLNQDNDWHGRVTRMGPDGTVFAVSSPVAGLSGEYRMPLIGRHQVVNALLAMAVAAEFGLTRDQVQRGLAACKPPKMRLEFVEARGVRVLDDSYNANTDSMRAALDALRELAGACPTIAVLGDMAELGRASQDAHAEVGAHAARLGIGCLVAVGRMATVMGQAARENGLSNVREYDDADQAADGLRELARPGDFVLVKASRATALERIVNRMRD